MSAQATIHRIYRIIEIVRRNSYPPFNEILNRLRDEGFKIGDRTLQRDLEMIRNEFRIELLYHHDRRGYYIDIENSMDFYSYLKFFELSVTADILNDLVLKGKDALKFILFDQSGMLEGIENLKILLASIVKNEFLCINHYNYDKDKESTYRIKPLYLKEYQGRWYVGALVDDDDAFLIFGIDRIKKIEITGKKFQRKNCPDYMSRFRDIIGVSVSSNKKKEKIVLSVDTLNMRYFKSLPLHHSQVMEQIADDKYHIGIEVIPNFELKMKILALGSRIKVIEPQWLANEIKETFKEAVTMYR